MRYILEQLLKGNVVSVPKRSRPDSTVPQWGSPPDREDGLNEGESRATKFNVPPDGVVKFRNGAADGTKTVF